ncbi:MAG: ABC transporter permease [Actinomycetota bacterium]|nr:ABC transporter permease [Actinomycetota bacterium]
MTAGNSSNTDGLKPPGARKLVHWSELLKALVAKEIKVKYKRSILGFFWSLLTPLALTGVYLFVFIYVYKVDQKDFIFFLLSGLLPWNYFNMSLLAATNSLVENGSLIRKVFFPRALIPMSGVLANLVNFLLVMGLFTVVAVIAARPVVSHLHWLLVAIVLETVLAVGLTMALSAWNVYLRDIQQLISILSLIWFFATPIVYPLSRVPARFRPFILANPMAGIIELYRSALYSAKSPAPDVLLSAFAGTVLALVLGVLVFRKLGPVLAKEL